MKITELRIGNMLSLTSHNKIAGILEIRKNHLRCIYHRDDINDSHTSLIEFNIFEPIPLTEEWLLKAGFKEVDYEVNVYEFNGVEICFGWGYNENENHYHYAIDFDRGNGYSCLHNAIDYIHQLQNLYFALTGEELIFNI